MCVVIIESNLQICSTVFNNSRRRCPASRLRYRIDDGVPVLLVDEATEVAASEVERLLKQAKELGIPGA